MIDQILSNEHVVAFTEQLQGAKDFALTYGPAGLVGGGLGYVAGKLNLSEKLFNFPEHYASGLETGLLFITASTIADQLGVGPVYDHIAMGTLAFPFGRKLANRPTYQTKLENESK